MKSWPTPSLFLQVNENIGPCAGVMRGEERAERSALNGSSGAISYIGD